MKGSIYTRTGRPRDAEAILKRALSETPQNTYDSLFYFQCVKAMVEYTRQKNDDEGLLRIALPAYEGLNTLVSRPEYATEAYDILAEILQYVGMSQFNLGLTTEAEKSFEKCYDCIQKVRALDTSWKHDYYATVFLFNIAISYSYQNDYPTAEKYLNYAEAATKDMASKENVPAVVTDMSWSTYYINRAMICHGLGKQKEADQAFAEFKRTQFSKTSTAKIHEGEYMMRAKRYAQAADAYAIVYQYLAEYGSEITLDNMEYLIKKFTANYKAGRNDSALSVAAYTFEHLDSAIIHQKKNQALELATIYQTQQKDAEIAEQRNSLLQTRVMALLVAIALLTVFFIVYSLLRRRAARMKAAQQRIEGELQIARDIQMSMVPHTFPNREGLDMYASMTPAKEVGGDLYGYLIRDHMLYFAVGDVSGKGVPASLFMAQATRLFQTMADQGMLPAEICTRMNKVLGGEDNVNGMFVTMFVGMLNMDTGHLHFCNAGHNPPVIGGGEHHGDFLEIIPNAPIGLWPDLDYEGEEIDTIKGRPLFIYTDGLNEAEDPELRQFGDERLLSILRNTHFDTAQQVIETLAADVETHRNGAEPNDDLTMMCLKVI
jgi:serine phosphatase RsbU (regulator of sigma subunit)